MASSRSDAARRAVALVVLIVLVAAAGTAAVSHAQGATPQRPDGAGRSVVGRVFTAHAGGRRPTPNVWVTLHRIGPDTAAPLDSVKTGPAGEYAFRYRPSGDTSAVYIVSGLFAGIAYFSAPLLTQRVLGGDADLVVYDTATAGVPVTIESRHVVVSAPGDDDRRRVVEVFVLANASDRTRVAGADAPTFRATLPAGASDPRVADGEVSADAMTFAGGVVQVTAPVAPGTKRVAFAYFVPVSREPFAIATTDSTAMLELLVEDSAATVAGNVVREEAPVSMSARTFRRYTAQDVARTAALRITAPSGAGGTVGAVGAIVFAIAAGMAGVLVLSLRRGLPLGGRRGRHGRLAPPGGAA